MHGDVLSRRAEPWYGDDFVGESLADVGAIEIQLMGRTGDRNVVRSGVLESNGNDRFRFPERGISAREIHD